MLFTHLMNGYIHCLKMFVRKMGFYNFSKIISARPRKPELIIRENEPLELPPDVVRGTNMFAVAIVF